MLCTLQAAPRRVVVLRLCVVFTVLSINSKITNLFGMASSPATAQLKFNMRRCVRLVERISHPIAETIIRSIRSAGFMLRISAAHIASAYQALSVVTDEPHFAEPIPNVTVAVGRDANLPCVVENLGTYKVAWIHIDRQMILTIHRHVISRLPRFSVSHDNSNTWLLHVSQAQQEDRGYYMCQVNTNPMMSQVGYLQVVVPPNILDTESTQSAVAVRENQNISLICRADGFPSPKLMWRREDGQGIAVDRRKKVTVHDGEQLHLTRISRTEMGAYLCIATNGVPPSVSKRIIIDVEFSPMIWVPNQLVGAPAGTDVTIDCHTEAHPRAISYWVYGNVMVLPSKKHVTEATENSYRAHMKLTVRNIQPGDFGNYRCISKNSLGETEGSIRLYEIPAPSSPPRATEAKSASTKDGTSHSAIRWTWAYPILAPTLHIILFRF